MFLVGNKYYITDIIERNFNRKYNHVYIEPNKKVKQVFKVLKKKDKIDLTNK